jgi:hypothetical protein
VTALVVPFVPAARAVASAGDRLVILTLGVGAPMVLLSISYEVLFYVCFVGLLVTWLVVEWHLAALAPWEPLALPPDDDVRAADRRGGAVPARLDQPVPSHRQLRLGDARLGFFFLLFLNVAYFGTGNMATIASFSVASVYRLTTVFNPFLMGGLLLFKIALPFLVVAAVFGMLTRLVALPPAGLFILVLSVTDVMTLNFFFLVRDTVRPLLAWRQCQTRGGADNGPVHREAGWRLARPLVTLSLPVALSWCSLACSTCRTCSSAPCWCRPRVPKRPRRAHVPSFAFSVTVSANRASNLATYRTEHC